MREITTEKLEEDYPILETIKECLGRREKNNEGIITKWGGNAGGKTSLTIARSVVVWSK